MTSFGVTLRRLRTERQWRQQDLIDALDGRLGRSTLANIETGRERPTARLWTLLEEAVPEWVSDLEEPYRAERATRVSRQTEPNQVARVGPTVSPTPLLAGPFVIESLQLIYNFHHSHSPEEVIEIRRVRATAGGASGFGLKFEKTNQEGFRVEEEALWGGEVARAEHIDANGQTFYLRRFDFLRTLRRGQVHEFAVRSWIERDPEPSTNISVQFSVPCRELSIHLNFRGPQTPQACWAYGPMADEALAPIRPQDGEPINMSPGGTASKHFSPVDPANEYGIAWRWG